MQPVPEKQLTPSPVKVKEKGVDLVIRSALGGAFGSADEDFIRGFVNQLSTIGSKGTAIDDDGAAFIAALVRGIKPQDQIEAMLGAQMAAVHCAITDATRMFMRASNIMMSESAERSMGRLTRIFIQQMDALKRYRAAAPRHVVLGQPNVNEGGQAIVATSCKKVPISQTATKSVQATDCENPRTHPRILLDDPKKVTP